MRFAVVGMGKVGHTASCCLMSRHVHTVVWDRNKEKLDAIRQNGIHVEGMLEGLFFPRVSYDFEEAIKEADHILVCTVAEGHRDIAGLMKGRLSNHQHILIMNSNWGIYEFLQILKAEVQDKDISISETGGVHLMSDLIEPCRCVLKKIKSRIDLSTYPSHKADDVLKDISEVFPQMQGGSSPIQTSMNTSNPILHAPIALFGFSKIEAGMEHLFYKEGATPSVVRYIEKVDGERLAVMKALGAGASSCLEIVNKAWNTSYGSLYDAIQANYPSSKGPKSASHRFISEDVPFGIMPICRIGRLLGIGTPYADKLVGMYEALLDAASFSGKAPMFSIDQIRDLASY